MRALAPRWRKRRSWGAGEGGQAAFIALMLLILLIVMAAPLYMLFRQAFQSRDGAYVGLDNFLQYFETPVWSGAIGHTLFISLSTTAISAVLAFFYAYALARTDMKGRRLYKSVVLLPLFAPTMMHGIGLIYLFGKQGLATQGLFGLLPSIDIELYGPTGIILSEIIYTFPQAFLIFSIALAMTDFRLYEAAESMGAGKARTFVTVTLPSVKYAAISALFVCFTLSFTDFGAPAVVGGQYSVLATDIYKKVIGQQNMRMGAVIGILLTLPALLAFVVDRMVTSKQQAVLTAKSTPYQVSPGRWRNAIGHMYCLLIGGSIVLLTAVVVLASLVKVWPYNLTLGWSHYDFSNVAGEGLAPIWNSIRISLFTAAGGTAMTFLFVYLIEKIRVWPALRQASYFISMLPLALPGLVIGLSYIFFFNAPGNPLHFLYGSMAILVLVNIVHFYAVPFLTASTALKKLDKEFELVSESMNVPFYKTLFRVTIPMSLPAIMEMAMYYFVNSMVTVSAVIFLYAPDLKPAAIAIVNMDDAGDIAPAAAMSVLIVAVNVAVRLLYEAGTFRLRRRMEAWQRK
ncbi:putative 2-aminoethylphosphonate ABC transporter permease subunit [Paenibacillus doosanensis]|uniref:2-aminoethylphosphonate transport system permease protein PhnU n=1 Tax=Paenibacillus konkukensis TaxID=2020716 RepID=A0ABY4RUX8_9BACL|nr:MULTISPECIES: putative 2-aminoethylphosphonate ABC transporter permease subunit [Paenibacillus]MCS7460961.1 putative 2-aminoethylphosphonate ABC transporter permease subunit [Paenibacillus doosanensis]UQZ85630.1 Putative 2-aminoethylphosphonate transport system permease protein PhnU [Paenibacillus konkukensis]